MADGREVSMIHRFVGFGLDGETDFLIVREHLVKGGDEPFHATAAVLGFADVSAFARQPKHDEVRAQYSSDINRTQGTVNGVLAAFGIVAGISAVDGLVAKPKPGRYHFRDDPFP